MSTHDTTKYSVNSRIAALQNAVTELQKENKELRAHLGAQLANLVKDATSTIQASLRIPQDGAPGRNGSDCTCREVKGDKGDAGDITVVGDAGLHAAVTALKLKLAKFQAAILFAAEQNGSTKHQGLRKAVELTLKGIEHRAR